MIHTTVFVALILGFVVNCSAIKTSEDAIVSYLAANDVLQGKAEIVFLLDRSGSVGAADFEVEKGFAESFLTHVVVDVNASRVAVISYSDTIVKHIDYLQEPKSKCFLAQEMHDVVYEDSGATNIAGALEEAKNIFKNARPNVNKVVVLISDGLATRGGDPAIPAMELKAAGVQIFCFGVGRFMPTEMERIASSLQHMYVCARYRDFKRLARRIRGDPHESSWSSNTEKPNCDHLCDSPYRGEKDDPGCCDHFAMCSCALLSGMHTCVCKSGYYGLSGLNGNCNACPKGTYKSMLEPTDSCTLCPEGSTTAEEASTRLSDCYCKEGYAGDPSKGIPCERVNCPLLQAPANGFIAGDCDTTYGSICHFSCNLPFYELVDPFNDIRTCQSNGEWSGKTAVCRESRCNPPRNPKNGNVICEDGPLTVGKKCKFSCSRGYLRSGSEERECISSNGWTGKYPKCIPVTCDLPPRVANGRFTGCSLSKKPRYLDPCFYTCNKGYKLEGPNYLICNINGKLLDGNGKEGKPYCSDVTPPEIFCPEPIEIEADKGRNSVKVNWEIPHPTDNSGIIPKLLTDPPKIFPYKLFTIGKHSFDYIAIDGANLTSRCTVSITVLDREPPSVLECPSKQEINTNQVSISVIWKEPEFTDNSNESVIVIKQTAKSGEMFGQGKRTVRYFVEDKYRNKATCEFDVIVTRTACKYYPPPDNGAIACRDWDFGEMCRVYCNEKYDFVRKVADWYVCNEDTQWVTSPADEIIPWPNCARPTFPAAVHQRVGFHYAGDCKDPQVQQRIKKMYLTQIYQNQKFVEICRRSKCNIDGIRVRCGNMTEVFKRRKRDVWAHAEEEHLELEFEIIFDGDEKFNDTEAVLQDFLATIRELKWDSDEEMDLMTTISPAADETLLKEPKDNPATLTIIDETTTIVCKAGSIMIDDSCVLCSAGTFYDEKDKNCVDCPVGYFQENQGQMKCEKCPEDSSTENPRTLNGTFCKGICSPGTYSMTGLETCISCQIGTYQDITGMSICYDCPNGTTTENVGSTSIKDCKDLCGPGSFSQNGLEPCEPCPLHHFQQLLGQTACNECPSELSTAEEAATEAIQCIDINPCLSHNSCLNNGSCIREERQAKCRCVDGFTGMHCEYDIDECDLIPCSGGICINTEGSFYCKCFSGFMGDYCEVEIDECTSTPCQNEGICIDKVNGYTCVCTNEYEGSNCEKQREICFRDVVCLNGGICTFGENDNSSFCTCELGFTGIDCSINIDECETVRCRHNGSCIDGIFSFKCNCSAGYTGEFCETDIDECENNLCNSGSTCMDIVGSYKCACPPGWNGTHCENKMDSDFILMFPESTATIANMASLTLKSPLTDATISLWVQTNDTERSGTPLSYAVARTSTIGADRTIVDNALTISDCSEVKVYVNNEPVVTDIQIADGQWHHLAFTWSSENSGMWALYKDGTLKQEGRNLRPNEIINGGGNIVIGQEQDTVGGGFNPFETFTGNITRLNIWNNYFSKSNITRLCNMDDELPEKVLAWTDFLHGLKGDVQVIQNSRPMISTIT